MRLKGKVARRTAIKGDLMGFGGRQFAREGAKIVLSDIRDELGERTATAFRVNRGTRAWFSWSP